MRHARNELRTLQKNRSKMPLHAAQEVSRPRGLDMPLPEVQNVSRLHKEDTWFVTARTKSLRLS
jgi:hypothetical protein